MNFTRCNYALIDLTFLKDMFITDDMISYTENPMKPTKKPSKNQ